MLETGPRKQCPDRPPYRLPGIPMNTSPRLFVCAETKCKPDMLALLSQSPPIEELHVYLSSTGLKKRRALRPIINSNGLGPKKNTLVNKTNDIDSFLGQEAPSARDVFSPKYDRTLLS